MQITSCQPGTAHPLYKDLPVATLKLPEIVIDQPNGDSVNQGSFSKKNVIRINPDEATKVVVFRNSHKVSIILIDSFKRPSEAESSFSNTNVIKLNHDELTHIVIHRGFYNRSKIVIDIPEGNSATSFPKKYSIHPDLFRKIIIYRGPDELTEIVTDRNFSENTRNDNVERSSNELPREVVTTRPSIGSQENSPPFPGKAVDQIPTHPNKRSAMKNKISRLSDECCPLSRGCSRLYRGSLIMCYLAGAACIFAFPAVVTIIFEVLSNSRSDSKS